MQLPCIVSRIRGNIDLIDEGHGGYLIAPTDIEGYAEAINKVLSDKVLANSLGKYNRDKVELFSLDVVKTEMVKVFNKVICGSNDSIQIG